MQLDGLRRRFWLENSLALAAGLFAIVTVIEPEWIEAVFRVDPDASSGALEWGLTVIAALIALSSGDLARLEWLRAKSRLVATEHTSR